MRRAWLAVGFVAAVVAVGVTADRDRSSPPEALVGSACTDGFEFVLGQGCAKKLANGQFRLRLDDGTTVVTHDDPPPPEEEGDAGHGTAPDKASSSTAFVCSTTERIELVYARPQDRADRFATFENEVRQYAYSAMNKVDARSVALSGKRAITPILCAGTTPKVHNVVVPLNEKDTTTTISAITSNIKAQGYNSASVKYWIWFDGTPPGKEAGHGQCICAQDDSSPGPHNVNNVGPDHAYVWGEPGGGGTMLHEATHAWGGVQNDSPNASGAHHCNDENDTLCYDDSGPGTTVVVCDTTSSVYDCGGNDYFNPAAAAGSYLFDHWNIGSCNNRFLRIEGCATPPGTTTTAASTTSTSTTTTTTTTTTTRPLAKPGEPGNLSATRSTTRATATVTWQAPTSGGAPTGYYLHECAFVNTVLTVCEPVKVLPGISGTSTTRTTSSANAYCWAVSAYNAAGEGPRTAKVCYW